MLFFEKINFIFFSIPPTESISMEIKKNLINSHYFDCSHWGIITRNDEDEKINLFGWSKDFKKISLYIKNNKKTKDDLFLIFDFININYVRKMIDFFGLDNITGIKCIFILKTIGFSKFLQSTQITKDGPVPEYLIEELDILVEKLKVRKYKSFRYIVCDRAAENDFLIGINGEKIPIKDLPLHSRDYKISLLI